SQAAAREDARRRGDRRGGRRRGIERARLREHATAVIVATVDSGARAARTSTASGANVDGERREREQGAAVCAVAGCVALCVEGASKCAGHIIETVRADGDTVIHCYACGNRI